jgi:hypothetical protein
MSLRTYFDAALKKSGSREAAEQRRMALGVTVKRGEEASRHLDQARNSLEKLRVHQERRRKECA